MVVGTVGFINYKSSFVTEDGQPKCLRVGFQKNGPALESKTNTKHQYTINYLLLIYCIVMKIKECHLHFVLL